MTTQRNGTLTKWVVGVVASSIVVVAGWGVAANEEHSQAERSRIERKADANAQAVQQSQTERAAAKVVLENLREDVTDLRKAQEETNRKLDRLIQLQLEQRRNP